MKKTAVDHLKRLFSIYMSDQQNIIVETQDFNESLFQNDLHTVISGFDCVCEKRFSGANV